MFRGSITALVTPFRDGALDEAAFRAFVDWQIAEGSHGLVPCGTTGEAATLSFAEHARVVALCVDAARGRVPVIGGAGSNSTARAIELVQVVKEAGADAALVVAPFYSKPNQEGIYAHFAAIHEAVNLPIVAYNVPSRTVADISVETLGRLAKLPRIVALKDATGDVGRVVRQRRACGEGFVQLSGDDGSALGFNAQGGVGAISVTSNVAPRLCAQMQTLSADGRYAEALAIQTRLMALHDALFCSPSPGPAKHALAALGRMGPALRLPLTPPDAAAAARIEAALEDAGLWRKP